MTKDKIEGDFKDIQAILQLMETRKEVESIEYYIGGLNDHWRYRAICTLNDGVTQRKYLLSKIKCHNGLQAVLIEIQRENLALSTLMCISNSLLKWDVICHNILKRFIVNSGVWPNLEDMEETVKLVSCRFKHTDVNIARKEKRIFEKIIVVQDEV